jgi:hypothetical protein
MEQQNNYGVVFGTIPLLSEEHLELMLTTMNKDHALYYLIEAVKSAHDRGSFTIGESEIISKSIRVLSKNDEQKKGSE